MNPVLRTLLCLAGLLGCVSCNSTDPASPQEISILGAWGLQSVDDVSGIRVYMKLESLSGNQSGYLFEPDGTLEVRSPGWCATPPITYSNFEGSWIEEREDCLVLTYPDWAAMQDYRLDILGLNEIEMRCRVSLVE